MGKQKSDEKKKKKKSSQLVIRIDTGERDAFVKLCDALDTSAAREIRRFMRDWVAAHAPKPDVEEQAVAAPAPESAAASPPEAVAEEKPAAKVNRKRVVAPAA
ncbi:hypothetical protein [Tabrizicola sp.]|uniref:hypothetical protein n=1 Tax=Tabrizicola sp. TaxID=2005166 RepID=UPI0027323A8C|nr:hypothetical protein [Tabrizicola sp.]MDP3196680.1 hypothetical protein [Tabrizicola sp.]